MKLQTLHEAKYHKDPRAQFLKNYFELDVEETEDGYQYQMWYTKDDFVVTIEWTNEAIIPIARLVSGKNEDANQWEDEVYPYGWDDPIELQEGLQELKVWKRVA